MWSWRAGERRAASAGTEKKSRPSSNKSASRLSSAYLSSTLSRSALALSLSSFAEVSEGNKPVKENSSASEEIILGLFKYSRQLGAFLKYPSLHVFVRC